MALTKALNLISYIACAVQLLKQTLPLQQFEFNYSEGNSCFKKAHFMYQIAQLLVLLGKTQWTKWADSIHKLTKGKF